MLRWVAGFLKALRSKSAGNPAIRISEYPGRTHLQIQRGEPFIFEIEGSEFVCEIPPLTVAQAEHLGHLQAVIRDQYKKISDLYRENPAMVGRASDLRILFIRSVIAWFFELSCSTIPPKRRRAYRRALVEWLEADIGRAYKILNELLTFNSKIESFFFDMPRITDGAIQPPGRDGWRSIGNNRIGHEGGSLLNTPILKIFDAIIHGLEDETVARINRARAESESKAD